MAERCSAQPSNTNNTMKITTVSVAALTFLTLISCTHVSVTKTGVGIYPATSPARVEIRGTVPQHKRYDEVGMVSADIFGADPAQAYNTIREKAAAIGADAVILNNQIPIGARMIINGTAIKYK